MDPAQTLHAFTLNLLNDPAALSAFGVDPANALAVAGLSDISATDVHEVVPLVLDYVPVDSLVGQGLALDSLDGNLGAIDQLKALTQNLVLSDYGTDAGTGMLTSVSGVTTSTQDVVGAFSSVNDLSQGLDNNVGSTAGADFGNPVDTVTGAVGGVTGGDLTSHLTGGDATGALDGGDFATGLTSGIGNVTDIPSGIGGLDSTVGGLAGGVGGGDVTSHVAGISHIGAVADVTSHVGDVAHHVGDVNAGVSDVHAIVSGVGNIGEVAEIGHAGVGDVLSGNDIHFGH
jgi:hypothetical protein